MSRNFGVRGHVRALHQGDMSPRIKAASCRRTPGSSLINAPDTNNEQAVGKEKGPIQINERKARIYILLKKPKISQITLSCI